VSSRSRWGLTPRQSIEAECVRRGSPAVVAGCVELVGGGDADPALVRALGGPGADAFIDGSTRADLYWLRGWGARGLLWALDGDSAGSSAVVGAVRRALGDEHWRVREMALKVVARHELGDVMPAVVGLRDDPVPRVRSAAARTVTILTAAGA
jgi:hypothetical protein